MKRFEVIFNTTEQGYRVYDMWMKDNASHTMDLEQAWDLKDKLNEAQDAAEHKMVKIKVAAFS